MAIPAINLTHEGFGRSLITVGKLVVFDRTLRDVHRFGFATLRELQEEADKVLAAHPGPDQALPRGRRGLNGLGGRSSGFTSL